MPIFDITAPDGKRYEIEGATAEGAYAALQKHLKVPPSAPEQMPSTMEGMGTTYTAGPGIGEEINRVGRKADDWARMAASGLTFGLADKFAGGMDALTGQAPSYDEGVKAQRAKTQAFRDRAPAEAMAAEALGGVAGGAGLIKSGVTLAGRVGPNLLGRVLGYGAEGAGYGGLHGAGNTYSDKASDYLENAKTGAATGLVVGGALPVLGSAAGAAYRTGSAFLGPRVAGAGRGASAMLRGAAQADEAGMRGLPDMGPDAMLVDAGPAMLGLGQGAGTGTGAGRARLVNALTERDARTGQRLAQTLDQELGPSPIPSRVEAWLEQSRQSLSPQYQAALANAAPADMRPLAQQLDAIANVERGPAQRAARQVREMLGDGVHQTEPAVVLNTREAIDGLLATEADPNTIRILTQARRAVDDELARVVPRIKDVDAQAAELHRQSGALRRGSQVFDAGKEAIRPAELADEIVAGTQPQGAQIGPSAAPVRLREGARAEVDRIVGTNVNDLNALERKLGTPQDWNSQKFAQVFGEGPHQRVAKALMDNRTFRDSYQKIVQNSQTAQRTSAANAMEGAAGGNVPTDTTLTGLGLKALNAVAKAISGASSSATKDEIGRILSRQGPEVQTLARELLRSAQTTGENSRAIARVLSSPRWLGATGPAEGRK
jgi:hypothetical protein